MSPQNNKELFPPEVTLVFVDDSRFYGGVMKPLLKDG